jgi:3-methylcrotonyl-CoA carboxylase alpha subunit
LSWTGPTKRAARFGDEDVTLTRTADGWRGESGDVLRAVRLQGRVVVFDGDAHVFDMPDPLDITSDAGGAGDRIQAPMPGLVKAVFVSAGEAVAKGRTAGGARGDEDGTRAHRRA